jgi:hypothetical protein
MLPAYFGMTPDRDRIVARFRWNEALSPETARPRDEVNVDDSEVFDFMLNSGWIREARTGLFYLDESRLPRSMRPRYPNLGGVLVLLFLLAAAIFRMLGWSRH